jgi:F-type H+-transporting ATPase subunit epsilon
MALDLQIVTAERVIFDEQVDSVMAPGASGALGILPKHAPLISLLSQGELYYRRGNQLEYLAIGGGILEVLNDRVVVLADSAERSAEIDIERAEAARKRAEETLARRGELSAEQLAAAEASLRRAMVRISVGTRRRRGGGNYLGE